MIGQAAGPWQEVKGLAESCQAPELCVAVSSGSKTRQELREKRKLYFKQGAQEVWFCDEYGKVSFYAPSGKLAASQLFPGFPVQVSI
jgi:Uma2 family endonuclease